MNNRQKESSLERFEVISRAADDCTYILADSESLTKEELEHKLRIRLDRIKEEVEELDRATDLYFGKVNKLDVATILEGETVVNWKPTNRH